MSKDSLGFDPLSLDPVPVVQQATRQASQRAVEAYRHNVVVRGLYVADRENPVPVGDPIGDDGKVLTLEDRQRIAAGRKPYDPNTFGRSRVHCLLPDGTVLSNSGYDKDLADRAVESIGESGQKAIDAQPEIRIVQSKILPPYVAPKGNDAAPSEDLLGSRPFPPLLD